MAHCMRQPDYITCWYLQVSCLYGQWPLQNYQGCCAVPPVTLAEPDNLLVEPDNLVVEPDNLQAEPDNLLAEPDNLPVENAVADLVAADMDPPPAAAGVAAVGEAAPIQEQAAAAVPQHSAAWEDSAAYTRTPVHCQVWNSVGCDTLTRLDATCHTAVDDCELHRSAWCLLHYA